MKAVLALILIYIGTFLIAIQGASNSSVEASGQAGTQGNSVVDEGSEPAAKEFRRVLTETQLGKPMDGGFPAPGLGL